MVKKFLDYLKKGIFWGSTIFLFHTILWDITNDPFNYIFRENITFHAIGILLFGMTMGISSIIFESERLSAIQKTSIHASISTCAFLIFAFTFGWIPSFSPIFIAIAIVQFAVGYFVIWTIKYFSEKSQINRINAALKKRDMGN